MQGQSEFQGFGQGNGSSGAVSVALVALAFLAKSPFAFYVSANGFGRLHPLDAAFGWEQDGGMTPAARWVMIFRTLGHPARLRILCLLAQRELCVCQLVEVLGLAFSTVSSHLALLRRAGLVQEHKEGRWVYYQLAHLEGPLQQLLETVLEELSCDQQLWEHKALFDLIKDFPSRGKTED